MKRILFFVLISQMLVGATQKQAPPRDESAETVIVGGQVGIPGLVALTPDLDLRGAIQAAGGPTAFGSIRKVVLTRGDESSVHDLTQDDASPVLLKPGDSILVSQRKSGC